MGSGKSELEFISNLIPRTFAAMNYIDLGILKTVKLSLSIFYLKSTTGNFKPFSLQSFSATVPAVAYVPVRSPSPEIGKIVVEL